MKHKNSMKGKRPIAALLIHALLFTFVMPAFADGQFDIENDVPPLPQAIVEPVAEEDLPTAAPIYDGTYQPTGETTAIDAAYVFSADPPTEAQVAYYGGWYCDYRVSFNENLAAGNDRILIFIEGREIHDDKHIGL